MTGLALGVVTTSTAFGGTATDSASARTPVPTVKTDLSALASGPPTPQPQRPRVSRDRRDTTTGTAGRVALPARPGLPKVTTSQTAARSWSQPTDGSITTCYCLRWGSFHDGLDIAAPAGAPIRAVGPGVVIAAGPVNGFGHWIVIRHDNGDVTVYGHMYAVEVSIGQRVTAGQRIAGIGSDGISTGPHVHFSVHSGGINGPTVDPVAWLGARGVAVNT
jgi:murein DD-endopeptidase MepM/ murein hydrolase activator NlpD